jgi:general secretion pathway protein C
MAKNPFKKLSQSKIGVKAQTIFETGLKKIDHLPPLIDVFRKLVKFKLLFLMLIGFLTADLLSQGISAYLLKPSKKLRGAKVREVIEAPYLASRSSFDELIRINAFCPGCPIPDLKMIVASRPRDCNKARPLRGSLKLIGTIVLSRPEYSVATVGEGVDTLAIRQNENFKNYGKVFEIRRNRVCFEGNDGLLSYIDIPDEPIRFGTPLPSALSKSTSEDIVQTGNNEVEIKKEFLMEKLRDPNILFQAHAVPFKDPGGNVQGFKILSIVPGSVFEVMGLLADDVIQSVNGEPMDSIAKAQELYGQASTAEEVNIDILRDGRIVNKVFKVKK